MISTTTLAKSSNELMLSTELCELFNIDDIFAQEIHIDASINALGLMDVEKNHCSYTKRLNSERKQKFIQTISKKYTEDQLKSLIKIYKYSTLNRFFKEYSMLVPLIAKSSLNGYIFEENVKILERNLKLNPSPKLKYINIVNISRDEIFSEATNKLRNIADSDYYKNFIYSPKQKINQKTEKLMDLIIKAIYGKERKEFVEREVQETKTHLINKNTKAHLINKSTNLQELEKDIENMLYLSLDYFFFERNIEKKFNSVEIIQITKMLEKDPICLNFLVELYLELSGDISAIPSDSETFH